MSPGKRVGLETLRRALPTVALERARSSATQHYSLIAGAPERDTTRHIVAARSAPRRSSSSARFQEAGRQSANVWFHQVPK